MPENDLDATAARPPAEAIRLEDVHKSFGSGSRRVTPLAGVSLAVERGSKLVIIGPSGTGKSVLLRLLLGLLEPDRGEIHV
ncbi:MAG: ATP-binding cassette domain-containing protein, partial [Planctomycetota bacterium]|nr:ATP-binding cassette domain-containing protein [Planctomycetota bacterium]